MSHNPDADIKLTHRMADVAAEIALTYFESPIEQWGKTDGTPVSAADLAVERALLEVLTSERPDDAVISEEAGELGTSPRRWILDPIDGTTPFLAGEPRWGTNIALEVDGELAVGVITRPARGLRWWAARGKGAYVRTVKGSHPSETRLATSSKTVLSDAVVTAFAWPDSSTPGALSSHGQWMAFEDELCVVGALAEGRIDVFVQEAGGIWDHAPQVLLITEAGGSFLDPRGGKRYDLGPGLYTNGLLEPAVLEVISQGWPPAPR